MEHFRTSIKELRVRHNLTQEELAEKVGVVRQTIAYLERGEYMPSLGLAWKIAALFECSIEDIFTFTNPKDTNQ